MKNEQLKSGNERFDYDGEALLTLNLISSESARGLAHSKTLTRITERQIFRQVLECGGRA